MESTCVTLFKISSNNYNIVNMKGNIEKITFNECIDEIDPDANHNTNYFDTFSADIMNIIKRGNFIDMSNVKLSNNDTINNINNVIERLNDRLSLTRYKCPNNETSNDIIFGDTYDNDENDHGEDALNVYFNPCDFEEREYEIVKNNMLISGNVVCFMCYTNIAHYHYSKCGPGTYRIDYGISKNKNMFITCDEIYNYNPSPKYEELN